MKLNTALNTTKGLSKVSLFGSSGNFFTYEGSALLTSIFLNLTHVVSLSHQYHLFLLVYFFYLISTSIFLFLGPQCLPACRDTQLMKTATGHCVGDLEYLRHK